METLFTSFYKVLITFHANFTFKSIKTSFNIFLGKSEKRNENIDKGIRSMVFQVPYKV